MQTLLLELGAPLVFAFLLLAIAKFIRALSDRNKIPTGSPYQENAEEAEEDLPPDETEPAPPNQSKN